MNTEVDEEMDWNMNKVLGNRTITAVMCMVVVGSLSNLFVVEESSAMGNTIYVDDSNTAGPWDGSQNYPYQTIQEGITAATAGDTLSVFSGVYNENVVITKDLTLIGESKDTTFIDGGGNGHTVNVGVVENEIDVSLSGFTIRNAGGGGFDGLHFSYITNGEILNNKIVNSQEGEGISLDHCQGVSIYNNLIINNNVAGISLTESEQNTIQNNTIQESQTGIHLYYSTDNILSQNTIRQNTIYGVYVSQSSNNTFSRNDFVDNGQNARDPSTNVWSPNGQGNYWDDYNRYDNNSDGIGDTPYDISGGTNKDDYPLGYFIQPEQPGGGNHQPTAVSLSISPSEALSGDIVSFNGEGTDDDGYIVGYQWRSNLDGILSILKSFSKSNLSLGTHTIYFKVMDNASAWSTEKTGSVTISYAVNDAPIAVIDTISPNPVKQGEAVLFQGHGSDEGGAITAYRWLSSEDGIIGTTASFTTTNLSIGTHTIYFQVKDDTEWSPQVSTTLIVGQGSSGNPDNQAPIAHIGGPYQGLVNQVIYFNGFGSYDAEGEISALWDFGENSSGSGLAPTHTYTSVGTYIVTLRVTDTEGLSTIASTSVIVTQSLTSGDNAEGFTFFNIQIPFPVLIIVVILVLVGVGAGVVVWIRRR
jgi:parallel beta-helix repeat protein